MKNKTIKLLAVVAMTITSSGVMAAADERKMSGSFSTEVNSKSKNIGQISKVPGCNLADYNIQGRVEREPVAGVAEFLFRGTPFIFVIESAPRFLVTASFDSTLENAIKDLTTKTRMVYKKKDCTVTFANK